MKKWKKCLAALLAAAMLLGLLAACGSGEKPSGSAAPSDGPSAAVTTAPDSGAYPLEPQELGSGEVKWSEEKTADGWMKVTNQGGETLGYSPDSGVSLIQVDGFAFKDLNKNGKLDLYEDWRQEDNARAADLASQLPPETIFGVMRHGDLRKVESDGSLNAEDIEILDGGLRSMLSQVLGSVPIRSIALWNNNVQSYVEGVNYGIPFNISSNPNMPRTMGFADNLALGATFDPELVFEVHKMEAKMLRALGVSTLLGPMIDLATEPRWLRVPGTFGEDPALVTDMANMAISGMQSTYDKDGTDLGWGTDSVVAMMKHWPGDGVGESGRESHSDFGKYAIYPGNNFNTQLMPFVKAALNLESVTGSSPAAMTSYSVAYAENEEYGELVGSAFSKWKIDLLRETYGFDGMICSDWSAQNRMAWGIDPDASEAEILKLMILAGVDQIGSANTADMAGAYALLCDELGEDLALERIQLAACRIFKPQFQVGLFENSYVSVDAAAELYESEEVADLNYKSIINSIVMLKNENEAIVPAFGDEKATVYIPMQFYKGKWALPVNQADSDAVYNVVTDTVKEPSGTDQNGNPAYTVDDIVRASAEELAACDSAIIIVNCPINEGNVLNGYGHDLETGEYFPISLQYGDYTANNSSVRSESISGNMIETNVEGTYGTVTTREKENRSYYGATSRIINRTELDGILYAIENMPDEAKIIVAVNSDRPMIFSEFESQVDAILLGFGTVGFSFDSKIFLDITSGKVEPTGLLPMQMPASMETVEAQYEDVPRDMECHVDTAGNTYDFGFGLNWSGVIQDERTAKYCVPPLTEPATQPVK